MPVLYLAFWLILNARVTVEVIVIGILVSILMSLFTYRLMGLNYAAEKKVWVKIGPITAYLIRLVYEVIKANVQMIKIILSPVIDIKPQIIYFDSPVKTDAAKVALSHSITLPPGAIIIELEGDRFGVHAIDASFVQGIRESIFVQELKKIEGGH